MCWMRSSAVPLICVLLAAACSAQPVPGRVVRVQDVPLYPDAVDRSLFYYPPGKLRLADGKDGAPDLSFLQIRYTGTGATGDQGKFLTKSFFSFRLVMEHRPEHFLRQLARDLRGIEKRHVRLSPLPIASFETHLLYTPIGETPKDAGKGEAETLGGWTPTQFWSERVVTVYPDANTSQLLWKMLEEGQAAMTVTFAFIAKGVRADADGGGKPEDFTALADSIPIMVDSKRFPSTMRQVDLNEQAPANFPLLNVYCFDFKEQREGEIMERQVQIEATAVTGRTIGSLVRFRKGERDVYSSKARFSFAIDMRKGYRYRIRDIGADGDEKTGDWVPVGDWARILDVTTKAGG